jgi:hypothetical protein
MDGLHINVRNGNLEVISKLLNSACAKYDCSVSYDADSNTLDFSGDDSLRVLVIEDTMNLFNRN